MAALCSRAGHYSFALWFLSSSVSFFFYLLSFFSSPNLSDRRLDVYHTSRCGPSANLECWYETRCAWLAGNAGLKKIAKKLAEQQYVLHMSPQYGELRPTSG